MLYSRHCDFFFMTSLDSCPTHDVPYLLMMIDTCERLEALASTKESICFLLYVSQKCLHVNTLDSAKGIKDHNFNIESTELDPILFLLTKSNRALSTVHHLLSNDQ